MKVAIIHYWLIHQRGGEKVLKALLRMFPQADLFTHVFDAGAFPEISRRHRVYTTFINRLPRATKWYQHYLPLMPIALERLDLRSYDLIISCESGPAKGIIPPPDALHICYCHSPMRYLWDTYFDYHHHASRPSRLLMPLAAHYLRQWDISTAARVDKFLTNSSFVARRIHKYYRREAEVVYPPVAIDHLTPEHGLKDEGFYLYFGQLVPYKRPDLAVDAFNRLGKPLVVIGIGPMLETLRRRARPNITFLGWQNDERLRHYLQRCRAVIFPALEDFGLVPVEAAACGKPTIAYGRGGACETVIDGETGILFEEQTVDSLIGAIDSLEQGAHRFDPQTLMHHATQFSPQRFEDAFWNAIRPLLGPGKTTRPQRIPPIRVVTPNQDTGT